MAVYPSKLDAVPVLDEMDAALSGKPRFDLGNYLENLSIGLGRGATSQLEGIKQMAEDPIGTLRSIYELGRYAVQNPGEAAKGVAGYVKEGVTGGPLSMGRFVGENVGPGMMRPKPPMQEITAHHGSPHRFDRFELSNRTIGTGEGAQAYGHGLYFAESPKVAGEYKASISANMYDTSIGVIRSSDLVENIFKQSGNLPKQLESAYRAKANEVVRDLIMGKSAQEIASEIRSSRYGRTYGSLADAVDRLAPKKAQGQMYTVDIPDEQIDKMLDWDKPLSKQPEILDKLRKAGLVRGDTVEGLEMARGNIKNITGQEIIDDLSTQWRNNYGLDALLEIEAKTGQQAASAYLRSLGIPGIRYLDGRSRAFGGGTRNFVVFDDSILRILNRE